MEEKITYILNTFDFYKVHNVMKLLNWKYAFSNTETGIPSVYELIDVAKSLLEQAANASADYICSTGGFTVEKYVYKEGDWDLSLKFCIENVSVSSNDADIEDIDT